MNGQSLQGSGRRITSHSTTDVMSVESVGTLLPQKRLLSTTLRHAPINRVRSLQRGTSSQLIARATPGRGVVIYDPRFLPSSTDS